MTRIEKISQQDSYERAVKRVKKLKGFYSHLAIFIAINIMLLAVNIYYSKSSEPIFQFKNFSTMFFWGIGLVAHAASVFMPQIVFGKKWEDQKIKQIMERNQQNK